MPNSICFECRLCQHEPVDFTAGQCHLKDEHGFTDTRIEGFHARLHAARDYPELSENTLGWYEGDTLVGIIVRRMECDPDDPMRDNFWSLP